MQWGIRPVLRLNGLKPAGTWVLQGVQELTVSVKLGTEQ
jgi:hypothetical protein